MLQIKKSDLFIYLGRQVDKKVGEQNNKHINIFILCVNFKFKFLGAHSKLVHAF